MEGVNLIRKHYCLLAPVTVTFSLQFFLLLHLCYKSELLPMCQEWFTVPKAGLGLMPSQAGL